MARLIGLDGKLLTDLYKEGVSVVRGALWKPGEPRQDVVYDGLKRFGVSLPMINLRLYALGIPHHLGRFPELFDSKYFITEIITGLIEDFQRDEGNITLSIDERSKKLTHDIAKKIADAIAYSPVTFNHYRLTNNSRAYS